jgi:hypothetical protein
MGDNTEMGTLAATEELHAKQKAQGSGARGQERRRRTRLRMRAGEAGEPASKGFDRPEQSSSRSNRNRRPSVPGSSRAT